MRESVTSVRSRRLTVVNVKVDYIYFIYAAKSSISYIRQKALPQYEISLAVVDGEGDTFWQYYVCIYATLFSKYIYTYEKAISFFLMDKVNL